MSIWMSTHCCASNINRTCTFPRLGQPCNYSSARKHTITVTTCVPGVVWVITSDLCEYAIGTYLVYIQSAYLKKIPHKTDRPRHYKITSYIPNHKQSTLREIQRKNWLIFSVMIKFPLFLFHKLICLVRYTANKVQASLTVDSVKKSVCLEEINGLSVWTEQ